jgi:hypothetical protein
VLGFLTSYREDLSSSERGITLLLFLKKTLAAATPATTTIRINSIINKGSIIFECLVIFEYRKLSKEKISNSYKQSHTAQTN